MYLAIVDEIDHLIMNLNNPFSFCFSTKKAKSLYRVHEDNHLIIEIMEMNPNFQLAVDQ